MAAAVKPETFTEGFHAESTLTTMRYRPLNGKQVSILSFGASSLGGVFHSTDDTESLKVVSHALKSGINLVDSAPWYGHGRSEEVLGKYFRSAEAPPRSAYYMNTKCGRYEPNVVDMFDFRAERVMRSVDESLARLGCGYLDAIQVHDPEFAPHPRIILEQTLPALQKMKDMGKVKEIGMTGYPLDMQTDLIERSTVPLDVSLTYCHYSLNDTTLLTSPYWKLLQEKGMGCINASPISMGLLTKRGPPDWHPAGPGTKAATKAATDYCNSLDVDISKLAMHFTLNEEQIATTLVSTSNVGRLSSNIDAVTATLSEEEKACLAHIRGTFFSRSGDESWACWQGNELEEYWENLGKALIMGRLYNSNPFEKPKRLSTS